jgi:hypothetical protein
VRIELKLKKEDLNVLITLIADRIAQALLPKIKEYVESQEFRSDLNSSLARFLEGRAQESRLLAR